MPRITKAQSNATELSNALTRAEIAETALADAQRQIEELKAAHAAMVANRNNLFAEREELSATLERAREIYVAQRDTIRKLRALDKSSDAQRAYRERSLQAARQFEAQRAAKAARVAAFWKANPKATSVSDADLVAWEQSIEA